LHGHGILKKEQNTVLTTPSRRNVALAINGAIAKAISVGTYMGTSRPASDAIDGLPSTFWADDWNMPAWLQVVFNQIYTIDRIGIWWGSHRHLFSILLSTDGSSWITVVPNQWSTNNEGDEPIYESFDISPTKARYIQIKINKTSAPQSHIFQAIISELEAYTR
jgi:hypothetical protein